MKAAFFLLLVTIFLLNGHAACSQTTEARFKYDAKQYNSLWSKQYEIAKRKGLLSICLRSVTFAKFVVGANGHVGNIDVYEDPGTPAILHEMLIDFIKSNDGMWSPRLINGKPVDSNPIILPFVYQLEACGNKIVGESTNETLLKLVDKFHDSDNPSQLNCTFLKPVTVFSQN